MPLLRQADVVAIGPGLGRDAWAQGLWERALASKRPLVIDADALQQVLVNLLTNGAQAMRDIEPPSRVLVISTRTLPSASTRQT